MNAIKPSHTTPTITRELSMNEKDVKLEIKKNRIARFLYLLGGLVSLGLGVLGIFLPGLPTTPFLLLAAALLAKSNEKLYRRLLNNKILGPRIRNYQQRKGVTMKGKYRIIAFMMLMVLFSSFVVIRYIPIRIIVLTAGVIGAIVVRFFVPTAKEE